MKHIKQVASKAAQYEKLRFITVGIFNSGFDISLYTLLVYLSTNILLASYISSSCAVLVSYMLHRRFTFQIKFASFKGFVQFLAVTLCGVWIIQPLIIYVVHHLLNRLSFTDPHFLVVIVPKLCAISIVVIWNYLWYSRFVFKQQDSSQGTTE